MTTVMGKQRHHDPQDGFTLIELLVAMVIFAMLALSGWQIMDSITRSRDRANVRLDQLSELQYAYVQLSQDLAHVTDYVAVPTGLPSDNASATLASYHLTPSFVLSENQISFARIASPDPRLDPPPVLARVVYRVENGNLIKQRFYHVNNPNETPTTSVLLTGIKEATWAALMPQNGSIETLSRFPNEQMRQAIQPPATAAVNGVAPASSAQGRGLDLTPFRQLPKGVQLSFSYQDQPVVWRFALAESAPGFVSATTADAMPAASTPSLNTPQSNNTNGQTGGQMNNPQGNAQGTVTGDNTAGNGDAPAAEAIGGTPSRNARDD